MKIEFAEGSMQIVAFNILPENDLLGRLKRTRLRGFGRAEVYRDASLEVVRAHPDLLVPAQRYVLAANVQTILDIADAFEKHAIDVFNLRGALLFWFEGSDPDRDPPIPFLPPIVEESIEPRADNFLARIFQRRKVLLINDGMHRVYAARKRGRKINFVLARNVPVEYPYYAYALKDGWRSVVELEELREGYQRKEYRNPDDYKALFRDFNEQFEGVQKQRTNTRG